MDAMGCDALRRCTPEVQEAATWSFPRRPRNEKVKLLGCWWELMLELFFGPEWIIYIYIRTYTDMNDMMIYKIYLYI